MAPQRKAAGRTAPTSRSVAAALPPRLLADVRSLIEQAREQVARSVNSTLAGLYWHIGKRIREDVLKEKRADYGEKIVLTLSGQLTAEYGKGFSRFNVSRMIKLAEYFPDERIVASLMQQLNWTHFLHLLPIEDRLKRDFYAEMCRIERWSTRTLRHKIDHLLYERTAIAKKPEKLIEQELEAFILELGSDFAFVTRQKRITVDGEDYYLDLLFYHRRLRRLVAIDLKLGTFQAADKGQMELYLRWLEKHDMRPDEEQPLGLILCADKSEEHVELLQLDKSGIRVAQYLSELPPQKLLEKKLHDAIRLARERFAEQPEDHPPLALPAPSPPKIKPRASGKSRKSKQ